jgi:hypothetical protein
MERNGKKKRSCKGMKMEKGVHGVPCTGGEACLASVRALCARSKSKCVIMC